MKWCDDDDRSYVDDNNEYDKENDIIDDNIKNIIYVNNKN